MDLTFDSQTAPFPATPAASRPGRREPLVMLTIGHSNRPLEELVMLLLANGVGQVVDVRTMPRSRRNPQFDRETLPAALAGAGIGYLHLPGLGGLRRPRPDSPNRGWLNASFRGFADYMQRPEFEEGLGYLTQVARPGLTAIMCAEALPWRCHRSLIADALTVRGVQVEHIVGPGRGQGHRLTPWAQVEGDRITYPLQAAGGTPLDGQGLGLARLASDP